MKSKNESPITLNNNRTITNPALCLLIENESHYKAVPKNKTRTLNVWKLLRSVITYQLL